QHLILLLHFPTQYNHLITPPIPHIRLYTQLHHHQISIQQIKPINPKPIILSPPPNSLYQHGSFTIHPEIYNLPIPLLRISYPIQLTTKLLAPKLH
ncbi:glutamine amidotransferase-related protein, partial [Staphylococcus epidermidis]